MSLREHLRNVLPDILPPDPKDAIKGTELIELVKAKLEQKYSDATLRYHLLDHVLRPERTDREGRARPGVLSAHQHALLDEERPPHDLAQPGDLRRRLWLHTTSNEALLRANKFRAVVARCSENEGKFPFILEKTFGEDAEYEDLWKFPDVVSVTWQIRPARRGRRGVRPGPAPVAAQLRLPAVHTLRSMKLKLEARARHLSRGLLPVPEQLPLGPLRGADHRRADRRRVARRGPARARRRVRHRDHQLRPERRRAGRATGTRGDPTLRRA